MKREADARTSSVRRPVPAPVWGLLGVVAFSLTLPATRSADVAFGPVTVGLGRSAVAAVLALLVLAAKRQPLLPPRRYLRRLGLVALGVVVGFPLLTSIALTRVDSVHGAVITGLIPAATAGTAVLRTGERPSRRYWAALLTGVAGVLFFAAVQGAGGLGLGDLLLLGAILAAGLGYTEGGALAREIGGWRVICWTLVLSLPLTMTGAGISLALRPPHDVTGGAVLGLGYVAAVSALLGFFAWYHALATGGIATIGQLQLAQPALTLLWSALLLGEHVGAASIAGAVVVVAVTVVGRASVVRTADPGRVQVRSELLNSAPVTG